MPTLKFIKKFCPQIAVYWGNPVNDGYGNMTFDAPREIHCRWSKEKSLRLSEDNKEIMDKADILVLEPLVVQGYLFLGRLTDIAQYYDSDGTHINPMLIDEASEITGTKEIPFVKSTTLFVYKASIGFTNILRTKKQYASRNQ